MAVQPRPLVVMPTGLGAIIAIIAIVLGIVALFVHHDLSAPEIIVALILSFICRLC